MFRIFIGYDERQPVSYTVLSQSIISRATKPVSISPIILSTLPIKRKGLTPFTFSRFMVPWLCDYEGWALFLDVDMILEDDITKLFDFADESKAIHVSKNIERFEWASLMLFNCSKCKVLTPEFVETAKNLHTIGWMDDDLIGDIPAEWNHLVGYDKPRHDAKLVHFTQGVPAYPETMQCEYSDAWRNHLYRAVDSQPWANLMGPSVHAAQVNSDLHTKPVPLPKFMFDVEKKAPKPEFEQIVFKLVRDLNREPSKIPSAVTLP